jgi:hypothetical protein
MFLIKNKHIKEEENIIVFKGIKKRLNQIKSRNNSLILWETVINLRTLI